MQMYAVVATGVLGLLIGFWLGRSIRWNMEETEEEAVNRQEERRITGNRQLVMEGTAIGSPVNGEIRKISQDTLQDTTEEASDDNTKCITILPADGRVYAPTSGKVLKLYPMGNRIRFRTDSGVELLLNICKDKEELHSTYYRCNVLPNEIVSKGCFSIWMPTTRRNCPWTVSRKNSVSAVLSSPGYLRKSSTPLSRII